MLSVCPVVEVDTGPLSSLNWVHIWRHGFDSWVGHAPRLSPSKKGPGNGETGNVLEVMGEW